MISFAFTSIACELVIPMFLPFSGVLLRMGERRKLLQWGGEGSVNPAAASDSHSGAEQRALPEHS